MPVRLENGEPVATREYFPHKRQAAIRQRTRWVTGIALQSWERHGWRGSLGTKYWLWRDRKGLIGNPVSMLTSLLFVYGLLTLLWSRYTGLPWGMAALGASWGKLALLTSTTTLQLLHLWVRAWCCSRIYGWRFAAGVPLRALYANYINFQATIGAVRRYVQSRVTRSQLTWLKTDHSYPVLAAATQRRKLGEILLGAGRITREQLDWALATKPPQVRLGEYLMASHLVTEEQVYQALSLQGSVPLVSLEAQRIRANVLRALPAHLMERFRILPVQVTGGFLYVASPEVPDTACERELKQYTRLTVRMHLLTASNYDRLRQAIR
jgi:adsorption protein B